MDTVDASATGLGRRGAGLGWAASTGGLMIVFAFFAAANVVASVKAAHPVGIGPTLTELTIVSLYAVRRLPLEVSSSRLAWVSATVGTFGFLAARPGSGPVGGSAMDAVYFVMQLAGAGVAVGSLLALGRSFGLVAANRGVKTRGPYGYVRHPVYAGYFIQLTGYVLESPTMRNLLVLAVVLTAQLFRIRYEERCLSSDPTYAAYRRQVRYRLLPYVY